jgi:hypothetical protein
MAVASNFSNSARYTAIITKDMAEVGAAAGLDVTVDVPDQFVPGDFVIVNLPSLTANLQVGNAHISAAGTVKFRVTNPTAAPIDPASMSVYVMVL